MKKWAIVGVAAIFVLGIALVVVLGFSNLGPLVEEAVNTQGPQITGTSVSLGDADVALFSGTVKLKGFVVGNPKGFAAERAVRVRAIHVDVDEGSLASDTIIIDSIKVLEPELTFERSAETDNLERIQRNARRGAKEKPKPEPEKQERGPARRIIIRHLRVEGGTVRVTVPGTDGKTVSAPLPDIHLEGIGARGEQGASPAEVVASVLEALRTQVMSPTVTADLEKGLKGLGLDPGALGAAAKKQLDPLGEAGKEGLEAVGDGVKGLLP